MSEEQQELPNTEEVVNQPQEELNLDSAIQKALRIALIRGSVVKGISEVLKALEARKVKVVFLADDCDNEDYKNTLRALAKEVNVPVISINSWQKLKDFCRLGLASQTIKKVAAESGKEGKIKPRCSSCAILEWGEESDAKAFIENEMNHSN